MLKDKKRFAQQLLILAIIITLAFIWGNSMLDRGESTELSTGLLDYLKPLLELLGLNTEDDRWLRKLAHFGEFALLGAELCCLGFLKKYRIRRGLSSAAALALFAAIIDETIQSFSGRHPSLMDVVLDLSGGVSGIAFVLIISLMWSRKEKNL